MKKLILFLPILALMACITTTTRVRPVFMPQPDGFVYVPSGAMVRDGKTIVNRAFYMSDREVTNKEYRDYLWDTGGDNPPIEVLYDQPDSTIINHKLWISKHIDYFNDPIFDDFPVVGLSKKQMLRYADWMSRKQNEKVQLVMYSFRLPTTNEWKMAATGGRDNTDYPWGTPNARNSKGCALMHYFNIDQRFAVYGKEAPNKPTFAIDMPDSLGFAEYATILQVTKNLKKTKRRHFGKSFPIIGLPVPAYSYFPNDYGLYGMSGNVAELTSEGKVLGGSYRTSSEYCKIQGATPYPFDGSKPQADIGFRLVCSYEGVSHDASGNKIIIEDVK